LYWQSGLHFEVDVRHGGKTQFKRFGDGSQEFGAKWIVQGNQGEEAAHS
jgi:hypothetical protein